MYKLRWWVDEQIQELKRKIAFTKSIWTEEEDLLGFDGCGMYHTCNECFRGSMFLVTEDQIQLVVEVKYEGNYYLKQKWLFDVLEKHIKNQIGDRYLYPDKYTTWLCAHCGNVDSMK